MEWRQQTSFSCADAFNEAQRWIEEVTGKSFGCKDFRPALENGVLLCDLINQLKPGIIKRVNRLSTPIAGLDNVNVFLKACGKLGLNVSQLFHPGDLQDLSTRANLRGGESIRRVKNVLITIYWLGRKAHLDVFYSGPQLNFKAFEGLLGLALSKSLDEVSNVLVKDSGDRECWYPERDDCRRMIRCSKMENSADRIDSLHSRALRQNSDGCGSDAEAEQMFHMETTQPPARQNKGCIPSPIRRTQGKQAGTGQGSSSPIASVEDAPFSPQPHLDLSECAIDEELFLQALLGEDSEDEYTDADPVLDDLYLRRVQLTLHQTSTNSNHDRFLPQYWTPEEEIRVRTIYLGSQRRPWYRKMQSLRIYQIHVRPEAPVQVNPGWIWSKSLSDIPMVYPVRKVPDGNTFYDVGQDAGMEQKWSHEYKRPCSVGAKDNEAQWHDDLTKWKNRRRSSKSDQRRKSLDREHVVKQMINGASNNFEKKGAHDGLQKRDLQSPRRHNSAPRPYSTSSSSKSSSSDLRPRTRALLARSYAIEAPFSPAAHIQGSSAGLMPASDGNILGEAAHFASLASDGAGVTTPSMDCPYSSQTQVKAQGILAPFHPTSDLAQPENITTNHISTLVTTIQPKQSAKSTRTRDPTTPISSHKEPPLERGRSLQAPGVYKYLSRAGTWSGSSSLPRGYRRSEGSSRLSSAITARPFGTKHSRMSSLPRLSHKDDIQGLPLKSDKEESLSPPFESSLKRQTASAHLKAPCLDSVQQKRADQAKQNGAEHGNGVRGVTLSRRTSSQTNIYQHQPYSQTQLLPQPYSSLQTHHKKSPTLPSNGGSDRIKVDHSDMRVSLALKPNSRPDFGFQTHWDSTGARIKYIQPGSPAELCQLCVDDEIVAVNGVAVTHMNYSQWKDKMTSYLQTGNLAMDIRRYGNKDWSSSEGIHHNQPGQSRVTLNLTASQPVLIGYADPHGNGGASSETTVTKVSTFTGQADNVMQGKVMHGQLADNRRTATSKDYNACVRENKKRREEFFNKKGGSESAISDLQVPSLSPSSSSWSWDPEEHRRRQEKWQEEQERLLQEQYQRDQERLESEWRRAQQEVVGELCRKSGNTFEMTNGGQSSLSTHANGLTNTTREVERSPELKGGVSDPPSNAKGVQHVKITEQAWAEDSCGFAQLSAQHRGKSLSTPSLPSLHKQTKVDQRRTIGHSVSTVEKERQLILEEMKKRTQLLTDNSWIRQRRSSFYKEPIYVGAPIKRYESLDNLDTLRQSPLSTVTFTYPRPHSVASGYCAPSRNAASRYSTSATLSQRNASMDSFNHGRMVSGRRTCCVCERVLGSGAAMVIEALSVCFHLACFQCVGCHRHLRGTGSGAQVRISNRKPYCEPCYFKL